MIARDQPDCFPSNIIVAVSSTDDGTMLNRTLGVHSSEVIENRRAFCESRGVSYDSVVYQNIVYGSDKTYDHIAVVDKSMSTASVGGIEADALFTKTPGVGLFLPVADCVATVVYDPTHDYLAMVHLGRDSTVNGLMVKVINKFALEGSSLADLVVWMSPSAKSETYVMQWFDQENEPDWQGFIHKTDSGIHLDLPGFNKAACLAAGVHEDNMHISPINTMTSDQYFSHSMGDVSGRFAVIAMMKG